MDKWSFHGKASMPSGGGRFTVETTEEVVRSRGGRVVRETKSERIEGEMYVDENGMPVRNMTIQRVTSKQAFDPSRGAGHRIEWGDNEQTPRSSASRQLEWRGTDTARITEIENATTGLSQGMTSRMGRRDESGARTKTCSSSRTTRASILFQYSYSDIKKATNGLSKSSKIGEGGYGSVYRGYIGNTEVAIKVLDAQSDQGQSEFAREVEILSRMRHPNLVTLKGACFEVKALVYEFQPNGSLEDRLNNSPRLLMWQVRTRIIYGICSALKFLHSEDVIHGDLKPANVLLDSDYNCKLGDFGLSRFVHRTGSTTAAFHRTSIPKGTTGYMDPEYASTGKLRPRCDVYAFGVTILRLVTALPALGIGLKVQEAYEDESLMRIVDPAAGRWPAELAMRLLYYGLKCCHDNKKSSELMEEISDHLESKVDEIFGRKTTTKPM